MHLHRLGLHPRLCSIGRRRSRGVVPVIGVAGVVLAGRAAQELDRMGQDRQQRSEALADTLGLPGRFTITVPPRDPATARDRAAIGVCRVPSRRISSPNPGASRSRTARVASGVTSRGPKPVPPVVTTRANPRWSARSRRTVSMAGRSSGTAARAATSNPASRSNASAASPEPSARVPWVTPSETVTTAARMPLTHPSCQTRPEPVRTRPHRSYYGADRDGDGGIPWRTGSTGWRGARRRSPVRSETTRLLESPGRSRTGSNARSRRSRPPPRLGNGRERGRRVSRADALAAALATLERLLPASPPEGRSPSAE